MKVLVEVSWEIKSGEKYFILIPLIHNQDISDHIFGNKLIDIYLQSFEHFNKSKKT